ncbi:hypothetical protein V8C86DRAFT_3034294 [Haematococcus lacustris]
MALTATADPKVQRDIVAQLQLAQPVTLVASFNRPNITYAVRLMDLAQPDLSQEQGTGGGCCCTWWLSTSSSPGLKQRIWQAHRGLQLTNHICGRGGGVGCDAGVRGCGVVYCLRREDTDSVIARLKVVPPHQATPVLDEWCAQRLDLVAATIAFGMGVDRPGLPALLLLIMHHSLLRHQLKHPLPGCGVVVCPLVWRMLEFLMSRQTAEVERKQARAKQAAEAWPPLQLSAVTPPTGRQGRPSSGKPLVGADADDELVSPQRSLHALQSMVGAGQTGRQAGSPAGKAVCEQLDPYPKPEDDFAQRAAASAAATAASAARAAGQGVRRGAGRDTAAAFLDEMERREAVYERQQARQGGVRGLLGLAPGPPRAPAPGPLGASPASSASCPPRGSDPGLRAAARGLILKAITANQQAAAGLEQDLLQALAEACEAQCHRAAGEGRSVYKGCVAGCKLRCGSTACLLPLVPEPCPAQGHSAAGASGEVKEPAAGLLQRLLDAEVAAVARLADVATAGPPAANSGAVLTALQLQQRMGQWVAAPVTVQLLQGGAGRRVHALRKHSLPLVASMAREVSAAKQID